METKFKKNGFKKYLVVSTDFLTLKVNIKQSNAT